MTQIDFRCLDVLQCCLTVTCLQTEVCLKLNHFGCSSIRLINDLPRSGGMFAVLIYKDKQPYL